MTVRFLIVGAGRMGRRYAEIVEASPMTELCALVGHSETGLAHAKVAFPDIPMHTGGLTLDLLDRYVDVDAVIIASPEWAHLDPACMALERGKHLLLEKPIADSLEAARKICRQAKMTDVVSMPCHTVRFDARSVTAYNFIQSGKVGKVRYVYGRRNADKDAFARIAGKTDPAYWLLPHDLDLTRWLVGANISGVKLRKVMGGGDIAGLIAEVSFENGAQATLETLWTAPVHTMGRRNSFMDIFGDEGTVELSAFEGGIAVADTAHGNSFIDPYYEPASNAFSCSADAALIDHFVRCIKTDCQQYCTIEDGFQSIATAAAAQKSLTSNVIEIPERL